MKQFLYFLVVYLLLTGCNDLSQRKVLYERLNYKIITPVHPTRVQMFAAEELNSFLKKTYSKPVKINGETKDIEFIVGVDNANIPEELKKQGEEFGVFVNDNSILFAGYDDKDVDPEKNYKGRAGTLNAVYYFLTKYTGAEFYFPGDSGYLLKHDPAIEIKSNYDIPSPSFEVRGISIRNKEYTKEENILFFRRLLGNIPYWAKKDLYYYYLGKWKKRFVKTHPEYLGLYNGKRYSGKYPYHLPCFSNPAVMRQSINDIIDAIKSDPTIRTVRIFADCPLQFCQCENCKAMPERKFIGETKENGEMVYGIVKKIMDGVHKLYPDIQFLTQTKLYTQSGSYFNPPRLVNMGRQCTVLHLTMRNRVPGFDHSKEVEVAKAWSGDSVRLILKSYERFPSAGTFPVIKPHLDQKFFKLFKGIALGAVDSDASVKVPYSFSALGQYLQMKMLFDIDVDIDKEIAEFCEFAYPGAAEEMTSFYSEMESIYSKRKDPYKNMLDDIYCIDNLKKPMQILEVAAGKVNAGSEYFKRLYTDFSNFYRLSEEYCASKNKN